MRERKEIQDQVDDWPYKTWQRVMIELLLDIRELLSRTLFISNPTVDCGVIPDRATLVKAKEKLDKLLKKP